VHTRCAGAPGPGLLTVAADAHGAPRARAVAGLVVEGFEAVVGGADLDPVEASLDRDLRDRRRDEADRRNVVIQRTAKGALAVERLGDVLIAKARELPR
jgi:hypothetical protein